MTKYQELKNKANSIEEELDKLSFSGHNVERVLRKYWSLTREMLLTIEDLDSGEPLNSLD